MQEQEFALSAIKKIHAREDFVFKATREELQFEEIERWFKELDFNQPTYLPNIYVPSEVEILANDALGLITLSLINRIRIFTALAGGKCRIKKLIAMGMTGKFL